MVSIEQKVPKNFKEDSHYFVLSVLYANLVDIKAISVHKKDPPQRSNSD